MDCFLWLSLLIGAIAVLINWLQKKTSGGSPTSHDLPPQRDYSDDMDPFFTTMIAMDMLEEDDPSDYSSGEYDDNTDYEIDYDIDYEDEDYDDSDYD